MKQILKQAIHIFLTFILAINLFACSGDDDSTETSKSLTVSTTSINFTSVGGEKTITIDAGSSWEITNAPNWITLSETSGKGAKTVKIIASKNELDETRTATITVVSSGSSSRNVQLTQQAYTVIFSVSPKILEFTKTGGSKEITITASSTTAWEITNIPSWVTLSKASGTGSETITLQANENVLNEYRVETAKVTTASTTINLDLKQKFDGLYPNYNLNPLTPDMTGMSSTATEIAANISLGWNLGNTLEATGNETAWGNPKTTKALIDFVKQSGFNAIRIPCSWNQYLANSVTAEIKADWMNRVKEVVQYCVDNNMYVILNIHWDGGWLENNVTTAKKDEVNAKQKAFWQQIATELRDFDEYLLFASANEPAVENATEMGVLESYHQTFVDAVRSTGGKNAYRTLVVQGPTTDIEKTNNLMNTLPMDTASNRLMVEVHYYTPWQFAGLTEDATWGKMAFYWGANYHSTTDTERNATWGEETDLENYFKLMKTKFIDNGIPVVLGEFGAIRRTTLTGDALTLHLNSRAYYLKSVVKQAKLNGMLPFYWDEGSLGNHGFGIIDRSNNTVFDTQALDALLEGLN
jgi:aryl-phospho-beta-D-glucosidase BglC (GH1 family)